MQTYNQRKFSEMVKLQKFQVYWQNLQPLALSELVEAFFGYSFSSVASQKSNVIQKEVNFIAWKVDSRQQDSLILQKLQLEMNIYKYYI